MFISAFASCRSKRASGTTCHIFPPPLPPNFMRSHMGNPTAFSSDLSLFFDGLESLLEPLVWQHSVIPALAPDRLEFLEAPTPFLMGLLLPERLVREEGEEGEEGEEAFEAWWREELAPVVERDPQATVIVLRRTGMGTVNFANVPTSSNLGVKLRSSSKKKKKKKPYVRVFSASNSSGPSRVLKRPQGSLALPDLLRADLAHCIGCLDKDRRKEKKVVEEEEEEEANGEEKKKGSLIVRSISRGVKE